MSKKNVFLVIFFMILPLQTTLADIKTYKDTDNTGINKLERIGVIEKYLIDLSGTLKNMESKLDATSLKLASLESTVKTIKDTDIKNIQDKLGEKKVPLIGAEAEELNKLKEDLRTIKNDDIEKMQVDLRSLHITVKALDDVLKVNKLR